MRSRTVVRSLAFAVGLGLSVCAVASAQSLQAWSVQGSALLTVLDFPSNAGTVSGIGIEAQLRRRLASGWSLGGGGQYSKHSKGPDDMVLTGLFVEPRYVLNFSAGPFFPYLAGRVAVLHGNLDSGVAAGEGSSNGFAIGGGGGLTSRLSSNVNFDVGGAVVRQSLGEIELDNDAGTVKFPSFFGYVVKAGLSIGF